MFLIAVVKHHTKWKLLQHCQSATSQPHLHHDQSQNGCGGWQGSFAVLGRPCPACCAVVDPAWPGLWRSLAGVPHRRAAMAFLLDFLSSQLASQASPVQASHAQAASTSAAASGSQRDGGLTPATGEMLLSANARIWMSTALVRAGRCLKACLGCGSCSMFQSETSAVCILLWGLWIDAVLCQASLPRRFRSQHAVDSSIDDVLLLLFMPCFDLQMPRQYWSLAWYSLSQRL